MPAGSGLQSSSGDGKLTVVIPTHNRYAKLRSLLASIAAQRNHAVEMVIVVDDSDEFEDLGGEFYSLRLWQIHLNRRIFISKAKNIGWKRARTEFVYFIDDDNVVNDSTFGAPLEIISKGSTIGAVMPSVLYKSDPNLVWVYATPLVRGRFKHSLVGRNLNRNPSLENRLFSVDALPNASIIRRTSLESIGGFDENLMINSSADLALRLKKEGWGVFAYSGAFIYHDVEPPGKIGWWASHGVADSERVRYELRDWFVLMRKFRGEERLFTLRAILESSRFVAPNLFAYVTRGRSRGRHLKNVLRGYVDGITAKQTARC